MTLIIELDEAALRALRTAGDEPIRLGAELVTHPVTLSEPSGPPRGPLAPYMETGGTASGLRVREELHWNRPRLGVRYTVRVLANGQLESPDGQRFNSPSQAASILTGTSVDGWTAWRREDETLIDNFRR